MNESDKRERGKMRERKNKQKQNESTVGRFCGDIIVYVTTQASLAKKEIPAEKKNSEQF